jgi:hypothetical protein
MVALFSWEYLLVLLRSLELFLAELKTVVLFFEMMAVFARVEEFSLGSVSSPCQIGMAIGEVTQAQAQNVLLFYVL